MENAKIADLFGGKPLRCLYDKEAGKWWYSAVDICAILTGSDYDAARKYWKSLKFSLRQREQIQLVKESDQLKMPVQNGKYYFTDVLDFKEVIYLIQIIPSPKAEPFRIWLAEVVAADASIEELFIEAGAADAKHIEEYRESTAGPYVRNVITREKLV